MELQCGLCFCRRRLLSPFVVAVVVVGVAVVDLSTLFACRERRVFVDWTRAAAVLLLLLLLL